MKYLFILINLLHSINALCQVQITGRILDERTGKPIPRLTFYVHRNYDKWIAISKTDEQGDFAAEIRLKELDSLSTYQLFINEANYKLSNFELDIKHPSNIIISLLRSSRSKAIFCSSPDFEFYAPRIITSLSELPDSIQGKLNTYLSNRLGNRFYNRIHFTSGNAVNINRLHKVEPNSLDYRWTVHNYYFCFAITDTLDASMAMDSTGRVTEELTLPELGKDPAKANIISKNQAIKIARKNNFYNKRKTEISFYYYKKADCFVWKFETCKYNGPHVSCPMWFIAAHTGQVIGKSARVGIRHFY